MTQLCRIGTYAAAVALAVTFVAPRPGAAQIKASEIGSVTQTIDGTVLTVEYSRPQARGRSPLFGGLVDWGYLWTPGANWATTVEASGPIEFAGKLLPAGKYSMWMQAQPEEWLVHLHPNPRLFHTGEYPETDEFQISVPIAPTEADHYAEVLTFSFPAVSPDGGVLRMHWGSTAIDVPVGVEPSLLAFTMSEEEMAPFLGAYEGHTNSAAGPRDMKLSIAAHEGQLLATIPQWSNAQFTLIPTARPDRFKVAWLRDGKLFQVEDEPMIFAMEEGTATSAVIIGIRNQPWFELERIE
ncbi:MAG: DUF2911 domain-containing protein [Gemmatimonadota bacterium]